MLFGLGEPKQTELYFNQCTMYYSQDRNSNLLAAVCIPDKVCVLWVVAISPSRVNGDVTEKHA